MDKLVNSAVGKDPTAVGQAISECKQAIELAFEPYTAPWTNIANAWGNGLIPDSFFLAVSELGPVEYLEFAVCVVNQMKGVVS